MIGLGRMGGNMVRRLMRAGHECVGYAPSPDSVRALEKEAMIGAIALSDLIAKLATPRSVWMMVPAAAVDTTLATLRQDNGGTDQTLRCGECVSWPLFERP